MNRARLIAGVLALSALIAAWWIFAAQPPKNGERPLGELPQSSAPPVETAAAQDVTASPPSAAIAPTNARPAIDAPPNSRRNTPPPTAAENAAQISTAGAAPDGAPRYAVTAQGIRDAMAAARPDIAECYASWLKLQPNIRGTVVLDFRIETDQNDSQRGLVSRARAAESEIQHEMFEGCVLNVVQGLAFDSPGDEPLDIKYPFVFSSTDAGSADGG